MMMMITVIGAGCLRHKRGVSASQDHFFTKCQNKFKGMNSLLQQQNINLGYKTSNSLQCVVPSASQEWMQYFTSTKLLLTRIVIQYHTFGTPDLYCSSTDKTATFFTKKLYMKEICTSSYILLDMGVRNTVGTQTYTIIKTFDFGFMRNDFVSPTMLTYAYFVSI